MVEVHERTGEKGGQYFYVTLSDGRQLSLSATDPVGKERVWLGDPEDKTSCQGQPGGIGKADALLDEWRSRIALDDEARALYWALDALVKRRRAR